MPPHTTTRKVPPSAVTQRRTARLRAASPARLSALPDDRFPNIRDEGFWNAYRPVFLLEILYDDGENAWRRKRGVIQRVNELQGPACLTVRQIRVPIADIETTRLEVMEIGRGVRFAVCSFGGHPALNIVLLHLSETEIAAAICNDVIRNAERLHDLFGICRQFLVKSYRLFV